MKKRLFTVEEMVRTQLEARPETRSDDRELVFSVLRDNFGITANERWANVIFNRDLPSFETIRRTRQKIQQDNEDLRATKKVQEQRIEIQKDFIEYALGEEIWI